MGEKSTHVETQTRIATIYRLLLNGLRRREIIQYVSETTDWGVSERSVDNYIKQAAAEISEIHKTEKIAAYSMSRRRLDDLYFKSMEIADYKTCLQIQKESNDLEGLKSPTKTEISGNAGGAIFITSEQVAQTPEYKSALQAILNERTTKRDRINQIE